MKKIQVFLRDDQKDALKAIAARTGQKQSDLVRRGVDLLIEKARQRDADWREATRRIAGLWKDRTDLDEVMQSIRERSKRRFRSTYSAE